MSNILKSSDDLEYLKKNYHLIEKLFLQQLMDLIKLEESSKNCVVILKDIHRLIGFYNVKVKDIKPIIEKLKIIKEIIEAELLNFEIGEIFDLLYMIARNSYNLLSTKRFVSNIHTGLFGSSDYISSSDLVFEDLYFIEEEQFYLLTDKLANFVRLFEIEGETKKKANKEYKEFISLIKETIETVIFLQEKFTPNTLLANPPLLINHLSSFGKKIIENLQIIQFSYSLKDLYDEVNDAIEGLFEIAEKFNKKPNKKITLEGFFYTREGAKKLQEILEESKKIVYKI